MYQFMQSTRQVKVIKSLVIVLAITLFVFPFFGYAASPTPSVATEETADELTSDSSEPSSSKPESSPEQREASTPVPTQAVIETAMNTPTASAMLELAANEAVENSPPAPTTPSVSAQNSGLGEIETIEDEPIPEGVDQDIQWLLVLIMIIVMGTSGGFSFMLWQKRKARDGHYWSSDL